MYLNCEGECRKLENEIDKSKCSVGYNSLVVMPNKEVIPCPSFKWLSDQNVLMRADRWSVEFIYKNDPLFRLLRCREIDYCYNKCMFYNDCGGGCKGQKLLQSKDKFIRFLRVEKELLEDQVFMGDLDLGDKKDVYIKNMLLEINEDCRLKCVHCSTEGEDKRKLSKEFIFKKVEQVLDLGIEKVSFSGGEPFLYDSLEDIISYCVERYIEVEIYSCGVVGYNEYLSEIDKHRLKNIDKKGKVGIVFSLNGIGDNLDNIVGRKGACEKILRSIKNASELGMKIGVHFVPMKYNIEQMEDVVKVARDLGCRKVSLLRLVGQGRAEGCNDVELGVYDIQKLKYKIKDLKEKFADIEIDEGPPFKPLF